jgi:energy-coupling factor transporter transmembrane protein EcfT
MLVNLSTVILLILFEIVALIVIVRLWMRRRMKIIPRVLWSVVLLLPFFGLLVYVFLHEEPQGHPDRVGDSGWNVGSDGGDSGGGHGGH